MTTIGQRGQRGNNPALFCHARIWLEILPQPGYLRGNDQVMFRRSCSCLKVVPDSGQALMTFPSR